jgi:multidrug efflux system membrane fusion protein
MMRSRPPFQPFLAGRLPRGAAVFGVLLGLASLVACGSEEAPAPEVIRPIKVLEIQGTGPGEIREYPGTVKAAQTAEMAFEVPGKIIEFVYKEGQEVEEGAVLARLDPRDYEAQFDAVKADYENSRVNFERAQKLYEEGALAALERDRRRTRMMETDAKLRTATKALEDTELRAPFAGIMARKRVEDYENVLAKQTVLVLTDDSHLELKLDVPERDLAGEIQGGRVDIDAVTERTRPEVVVTSIPDRRFPARFSEIASTADPETRTFEVTVIFERVAGISILPGMTAKLIVHAANDRGAARGIRIPASATAADENGKAFVWRIEKPANTVKKHPVTLGELVGRDVLVTDGLEDGVVIAISGVSQLREGMTIRPLTEK